MSQALGHYIQGKAPANPALLAEAQTQEAIARANSLAAVGVMHPGSQVTQETYHNLRTMVDASQHRIAQSHADLATLGSRTEALGDLVRDLRQQLAEAKQAQAAAEQQVMAAAQGQSAEVQAVLMQQEQNHRQELERERALFQEKVRFLTDEAQGALAAQGTAVQALMQERREWDAKRMALEAVIEAKKKDNESASQASLLAANDLVKRSRLEAQDAVLRMKEGQVQLESHVAMLEGQIQDLNAQLDAAQSSKQSVSAALEESEHRVEQLDTLLEDVIAEAEQREETLLQDAEGQIQSLTAEITEAEGNLATVQAEAAAAKDRAEESFAELMGARAEGEATVAALNAARVEKEALVAAAEDRVAQAAGAVETLRGELGAMKKRLETADARANSSNVILQERNAALGAEVENLERKIKALEESRTSLSASLEDSGRRIATGEAMIAELETQLKEAQRQADEEAREASKLIAQMRADVEARVAAEISQAEVLWKQEHEALLHRQKERTETLEARSIDLQQQLEQARQDKERGIQDTQALFMRDIEALKSEVDEAKAAVDALEDEKVAELEVLSASHADQVEAIRASHNSELEEIAEKERASMENLKTVYKETMATIQNQFKTDLGIANQARQSAEEAEQAAVKDKEDLRLRHRAATELAAKARVEKDSLITAFRREEATLRQQLAEVSSVTQSAREDMEALARERAGKETEIKRLREAMALLASQAAEAEMEAKQAAEKSAESAENTGRLLEVLANTVESTTEAEVNVAQSYGIDLSGGEAGSTEGYAEAEAALKKAREEAEADIASAVKGKATTPEDFTLERLGEDLSTEEINLILVEARRSMQDHLDAFIPALPPASACEGAADCERVIADMPPHDREHQGLTCGELARRWKEVAARHNAPPVVQALIMKEYQTKCLTLRMEIAQAKVRLYEKDAEAAIRVKAEAEKARKILAVQDASLEEAVAAIKTRETALDQEVTTLTADKERLLASLNASEAARMDLERQRNGVREMQSRMDLAVASCRRKVAVLEGQVQGAQEASVNHVAEVAAMRERLAEAEEKAALLGSMQQTVRDRESRLSAAGKRHADLEASLRSRNEELVAANQDLHRDLMEAEQDVRNCAFRHTELKTELVGIQEDLQRAQEGERVHREAAGKCGDCEISASLTQEMETCQGRAAFLESRVEALQQEVMKVSRKEAGARERLKNTGIHKDFTKAFDRQRADLEEARAEKARAEKALEEALLAQNTLQAAQGSRASFEASCQERIVVLEIQLRESEAALAAAVSVAEAERERGQEAERLAHEEGVREREVAHAEAMKTIREKHEEEVVRVREEYRAQVAAVEGAKAADLEDHKARLAGLHASLEENQTTLKTHYESRMANLYEAVVKSHKDMVAHQHATEGRRADDSMAHERELEENTRAAVQAQNAEFEASVQRIMEEYGARVRAVESHAAARKAAQNDILVEARRDMESQSREALEVASRGRVEEARRHAEDLASMARTHKIQTSLLTVANATSETMRQDAERQVQEHKDALEALVALRRRGLEESEPALEAATRQAVQQVQRTEEAVSEAALKEAGLEEAMVEHIREHRQAASVMGALYEDQVRVVQEKLEGALVMAEAHRAHLASAQSRVEEAWAELAAAVEALALAEGVMKGLVERNEVLLGAAASALVQVRELRPTVGDHQNNIMGRIERDLETAARTAHDEALIRDAKEVHARLGPMLRNTQAIVEAMESRMESL